MGSWLSQFRRGASDVEPFWIGTKVLVFSADEKLMEHGATVSVLSARLKFYR